MEENTENSKGKRNYTLLVFGIFMCVAYFFCGVCLIAFKQLMPQYSYPVKLALGGVLIVYSSIRAYRVYKQHYANVEHEV